MIGPENTRYAFDQVDQFLYRNVAVPSYWYIRERAGAFSNENVKREDGASGYLEFLHEVGLQSHLAITGLAGAQYHLSALREADPGYVPLQLMVWEELPSGFNSLYKAWNGLYSFCFALLFPDDLTQTRLVPVERGFQSVKPSTKMPSGTQVKKWLEDHHREVHGLFESSRQTHVYRHVDVHSRRLALRWIIDPTQRSYQVQVPREPYKRPSSVVPNDQVEWENAIDLLQRAIEDHESGFERIYQYLLEDSVPEKFLIRYGLQLIRVE